MNNKHIAKVVITGIFLFLVIILYKICNPTPYTSKQVTNYLKGKYDLEELELLSDEKLDDIKDTAKNRHIYTYRTGDVEFTVEAQIYRYDMNISYMRRNVSNYHKQLVLANEEIRSKIENSGFEWYIDDEEYVICWGEYQELEELSKLIADILVTQESLVDLSNIYINDFHAAVRVNIMKERSESFYFSSNNRSVFSYDEVYDKLDGSYQKIAEQLDGISEYKRTIMESDEIRSIIEESGLRWDIENENYVIYWEEYEEIYKIAQMALAAFEVEIPRYKYASTFTESVAIIVNVMGKEEMELLFPFTNEKLISKKSEIFDVLKEGYERSQ